ncbi:hypothetical protein MMC14_008752 [Varicellaria rhodocarpa]|nr:hypothetical protein [Varicellaria rhodocarpa]
MLIAFRFFAGCFGAAPVAIGGAIVSDLFPQERRGNAMAIYGVGPVLGPLLGPIIGGYVAQAWGWRSIFWVANSADNKVFAAARGAALRARRHPARIEDKRNLDANTICAIRRPLRILRHSPAILLCCSLLALVSGINNLINTTLGLSYQKQYHFSTGESGLVYMGLALGSVAATFVAARTSDRILKFLAARNADGEMRPEYRLPTIAIGAPLIAVGLIIYGWTAEYKLFWFVPLLGLFILGTGITTLSLAMRTYLVDAYTTYAASVLAASTMTRSVSGSLIPLAGPALNRTLGLGWGNSLLALLILCMCPVALILYIYGPKLRERYPIANV